MSDNIEVLETSEKKKKKKISSKISLIFYIISLFSSGYLIYNIFKFDGIEDLIRYLIIGVLVLIDIILLIKMKGVWKNKQSKKNIKKGKESKRVGFIIFLILYSIISIALGYIMSYFYEKANSLNKKYVEYSSSLYVLSGNSAEKISDIKDYKIAVLNNKKSPDGYIIPQEIIKEKKLQDNNDIEEYESYTEMIADLYSEDIDAVFLPTDLSSYSSIAGYENIVSETKEIIKKTKKMLKTDVSKEETASTGKSLTEPFTILLMGVDSTEETLAKNTIANGDSLMLITFNPKTLNATMLSIPRDSYVPIACWPGKDENKITHAAAYGNDCMINTIEDFFDVDIDYYAKINFKGLVKLVDALGGIDVEVPQDLCTDDSGRMKIVCINKGYQHLDGEGALVLSRNRKQLENGDFGRGQNQQLVIKAMLEKIKQINSIGQFTTILNTVSNSLDTNLTTKQILSFYSVAKDIIKTGLSNENADIVNIQQLYLQGASAMIYDKRMRMTLYDYVPNTYSQKDITKAMKQNLELTDHNEVKTFSFSINKPYEKTIIGYGPYKSTYNASKYATEDNSSSRKKTSCGTNEELGADGVSCVCKWGYSKVNGVCTDSSSSSSSNSSSSSSNSNSNSNTTVTYDEDDDDDGSSEDQSGGSSNDIDNNNDNNGTDKTETGGSGNTSNSNSG